MGKLKKCVSINTCSILVTSSSYQCFQHIFIEYLVCMVSVRFLMGLDLEVNMTGPLSSEETEKYVNI